MLKPLTETFLRKCYDQGLSQLQIAAKSGWSAVQVRNKQREFGIPPKNIDFHKEKSRSMTRPLLKVDGIQMLRAYRHPDTFRRWMAESRCRCGKVFTSDYQNIKHRKVKSCGCIPSGRKPCGYNLPKLRARRQKKQPHVNRTMVLGYANGAARRGLTWGVTTNVIERLFHDQDGRCALSGVQLSLPIDSSRRGVTASLDRKLSSVGYIESNLQWVHKTLNRMKGNQTDAAFIAWCQAVADYQREVQNTTNEDGKVDDPVHLNTTNDGG